MNPKKKDYKKWMKIKAEKNNSSSIRTIKEGDVWWTAVGENVGVEIDGKSKKFSRPVLVLKKFSRFCFMGVPLTSQPKKGSWYVKFIFQNKIQTASLIQARLYDVSRLYNKIGQVPNSDLKLVRDGFLNLFK